VSRVMINWSRNVLGDLDKRIKRLEKEVAKCIKWPLTQESVQREQVLRYKLGKLEEQKEIYWRQRAHVNWLTAGDWNTTFFHACASQRKKRNRIKKLRTDDGQWINEPDLCHYIGN
jgi:hypothetical protein